MNSVRIWHIRKTASGTGLGGQRTEWGILENENNLGNRVA